MSKRDNIDVARRWMNPGLNRLFEAEIRNEDDGGVRPATVSSTIDSVVQMPGDVLDGITQDDSENTLLALLAVRDRVPGSTQVQVLLAEGGS